MGYPARIFNVFALTALASTLSCAENQSVLVVTHVPVWPLDTSGDAEMGTCVADPSGAASLGRGTLDLAAQTPYTMPAVVVNNLQGVDPASSPNGIDDAEIQLLDAQVDLSTPQDPAVMDGVASTNEALTSFTQTLATVSLPAGSEQGVLMQVIPQQTARELRSILDSQFPPSTVLEVRAEVVVRGQRSSGSGPGSTVESRPFVFPIDICVGCLADCSGCADGTCPDASEGWVGGVCGSTQDVPWVPTACTGE